MLGRQGQEKEKSGLGFMMIYDVAFCEIFLLSFSGYISYCYVAF